MSGLADVIAEIRAGDDSLALDNKIRWALVRSDEKKRPALAQRIAAAASDAELAAMANDTRALLLDQLLDCPILTAPRRAARNRLYAAITPDHFHAAWCAGKEKDLVRGLKESGLFAQGQANWAEMTTDERIALLQEAADRQARLYGFAPARIEGYSQRPGNEAAGPLCTPEAEGARLDADRLLLNTDSDKSFRGFLPALGTVLRVQFRRHLDQLAASAGSDTKFSHRPRFALLEDILALNLKPGGQVRAGEGDAAFCAQPVEAQARAHGARVMAALKGEAKTPQPKGPLP